MNQFKLGLGIDLDFGASQPSTVSDMTAEGGNALPFQEGATAVAVLALSGWSQNEDNATEMTLQGSPNGLSGWEDVLDENGDAVVVGGATASPWAAYTIQIPAHLRLRNTSVTAGDGYGSAYLLQN